MTNVVCLRCRECKREFPVEPGNVCDFCFGPLEVVYDYSAIKKVISRDKIEAGPFNLWRYQDLLPVDAANAIDINAGFTPLIRSKGLAEYLGLKELYIKNDSVNPSYSFKDRVVAVASTKALEFGFDTLACASTGNLACSVAAHAARAGVKSFVFIPHDLEKEKVVGAAVYGPTLIAVKGSYDDVNRVCSEVADQHHWAFVNINMRPFYSEGSKTLGYEVVEQLGWRIPDHAVVPAASGSLFVKIWKGLHELNQLDLAGDVKTKMHLVQAEGCSPIVQAYQSGVTHVKPTKPNTVAKSLGIGNPADGFYSLQVMKSSKGSAVSAPEEEIAESMKLLAQTEGIFTETAGGVVISGLRKLVRDGRIKPDDCTVVYITGNGYKTHQVVEDVVNPIEIAPSIDSFEEALATRVSV